MFEKEAKSYAKSKFNEEEEQAYLHDIIAQTYQRGAEFGYNKANEWHKDLLTEDVKLAIIEVKDCGYLLCEYREGIWYDNGSSAVCKDWITRNIKRWKEIILPELKESE